jgi:hypothetical protein
MIKRITSAIGIMVFLMSSYAYAEIYTYIGKPFTDVGGVYTTNMRMTGTLTTSIPIPPSSPPFDISPILTSWSFNDGVNTISSSNGETFPGNLPIFGTDDEGNISGYYWLVISSPIGTTVGDLNNAMRLEGTYPVVEGGNLVYTGLICNSVVDGVCNGWDRPESFGSVDSAGVWFTGERSTSIPALSKWSLIALASMLGIVGIARVRLRA